ncbi:MAG: hypothetical protein U5R31_07545 [Acidimicrobiia bacterium]|nr:hypothetical protein [Acidimicrobiia bacterium]
MTADERRNHVLSAGYLRFFGRRMHPGAERVVHLFDLDDGAPDVLEGETWR